MNATLTRIMALLNKPAGDWTSRAHVASYLMVSDDVAKAHLQKLVGLGLVTCRAAGVDIAYQLTEAGRQDVYMRDLLARFTDFVTDAMADGHHAEMDHFDFLEMSLAAFRDGEEGDDV